MTKEKKLVAETRTGRSVFRPHKYNTSSSEEVVQKKKLSSKKDNMMRTLHKLRKMVEEQNKGETAMSSTSGSSPAISVTPASLVASQATSVTSRTNSLASPATSASPAASVAASTSSATSVASGNGKIVFAYHKDSSESQRPSLQTFRDFSETRDESTLMDFDEESIANPNFSQNLVVETDSVIITMLSKMNLKIEHLSTQNEQVLKQNEQLWIQNEELKKAVHGLAKDLKQAQLAGESRFNTSLLQPLEGFPLSNVDDFNQMEAGDSVDVREKLFQHFISLGGSTAREFLSCCMRQIFTDEFVASHLTWDRSKGKMAFRDAKIGNTLYLAAQKCPFKGPNDRTEFKNDIKEILRDTKQRHKHAGQKTMSKKNKTLPGLETEEEIGNEIQMLQKKLGITDEVSDADVDSGSEQSKKDDQSSDDNQDSPEIQK